MRVLGLSLIATAAVLSACAGPADPSTPDAALAYRTGSRVKQPDTIQPNLSYYGQDQLAKSPNYTVSGAILHSPTTPVPPPSEPAPQ